MSEDRPEVPIGRRLVAAAVGVGILILAGVVARLMTASSTAEGRLEAVLRNLDETDPGWRLDDLDAARPALADEANSARFLRRVFRPATTAARLPQEFARLAGQPPRVRMPAEDLGRLDAVLQGRQAEIDHYRLLAGMPRGQPPDRPDHAGYAATGSNPTAAIEVTRYLTLDAVRLAQQRKPAEALASCRAMLNVARSHGDSASHGSAIGHANCLQAAGTAIQSCLSVSPAGEADLLLLANELAAEETNDWLLNGRRRDRAIVHRMLDMVGSGQRTFDDLGIQVGQPAWWRRLATRSLASRVRQEHPALLEVMTRGVEVARLPLHDQAPEELKLIPARRSLEFGDFFYDQVDTNPAESGECFRNYAGMVRCLRVLVALERHARAHRDAWPKALDELVPAYLDRVPLDPFDGKPLRYAIQGDEAVIYSVGVGGKDDGKVITWQARGSRGHDYGYRLPPRNKRPLPPEKGP